MFGWQLYRVQAALLHKILLFPAALVFFVLCVCVSVGKGEVVPIYQGSAQAMTRVAMPITFIGI